MCAAAVENNDISNAVINKNLVFLDYFCALKPFMYIDAKYMRHRRIRIYIYSIFITIRNLYDYNTPFLGRRIYYTYYTRYQFGGGSLNLCVFSIRRSERTERFICVAHTQNRMLKVKGEKGSRGKRMKKKNRMDYSPYIFRGKDPVSAREKGNFLIRLNRRLWAIARGSLCFSERQINSALIGFPTQSQFKKLHRGFVPREQGNVERHNIIPIYLYFCL